MKPNTCVSDRGRFGKHNLRIQKPLVDNDLETNFSAECPDSLAATLQVGAPALVSKRRQSRAEATAYLAVLEKPGEAPAMADLLKFQPPARWLAPEQVARWAAVGIRRRKGSSYPAPACLA
jgi:hypothetical protein